MQSFPSHDCIEDDRFRPAPMATKAGHFFQRRNIMNQYQKEKLRLLGIPARMHGGIVRYVEDGIQPGHFLTAVINNDLREACGRADDENVQLLANYVRWFYNYAPSGCWGSSDSATRWARVGGLRGSCFSTNGINDKGDKNESS
jgi:hypothetical protein